MFFYCCPSVRGGLPPKQLPNLVSIIYLFIHLFIYIYMCVYIYIWLGPHLFVPCVSVHRPTPARQPSATAGLCAARRQPLGPMWGPHGSLWAPWGPWGRYDRTTRAHFRIQYKGATKVRVILQTRILYVYWVACCEHSVYVECTYKIIFFCSPPLRGKGS